METLVHVLRCGLGTGVLAMPHAFSKSGLIIGILGTVLAGVLLAHCLRILVHSQYEACKHKRVPLLTYPEAFSTTLTLGPKPLHRFTRPCSVVVDVFLVVFQLGVCCVYILFIAGSIKKIVDPLYVMSIEIHMLIILGPLLVLSLMHSLKLLAPFSAVANVITLFSLTVIAYFLLTDQKSNEPLDLWGSPKTWPLFIGTALFALTSVGVVVTVANNMKTPNDFGKPCGVLNITMAFIVVIYAAFGCIGYLYCVSECSDSITFDLPQNSWLAKTVTLLYAVAIFISYGLHCYVPVEVLWTGYVLPRVQRSCPRRALLCNYLLRIGLCLFTFTVSVLVPMLALFISLFGAMCLSTLGLCFPAIMQACLNYPKERSTARKLIIIKDMILFVLGVVAMLAGTYTALDGIVRSVHPTDTPPSRDFDDSTP